MTIINPDEFVEAMRKARTTTFRPYNRVGKDDHFRLTITLRRATGQIAETMRQLELSGLYSTGD